MPKHPQSQFGKDIDKCLVDLDKSKNWLIAEVRKKTGLFFDSSYLSKIKTGKLSTPRICQAICDILGISAPPTT